MSLHYQEFRPNHKLASTISCYWSLTTRGKADLKNEIRFISDGAVEIIICESGYPPGIPPALVMGALTKPAVFEISGNASFLGIRFRPGGAYPFLQLPLKEVTDSSPDLSDLWREGASFADQVMSLREKERINMVERAMLRQSAK